MSHADEQDWGTWDEAERWRHEAFQRRSPVDRLAWLEDVWALAKAAGRVPSPGITRADADAREGFTRAQARPDASQWQG